VRFFDGFVTSASRKMNVTRIASVEDDAEDASDGYTSADGRRGHALPVIVNDQREFGVAWARKISW